MQTRIILAATLLMAATANVHAQQSTSAEQLDPTDRQAPGESPAARIYGSPEISEQSETCTLCIRGRPQPDCSSFLITEFSLMYPLAGVEIEGTYDFPVAAALELGWMKNVDERFALGASAFVMGAGESQARWGGSMRFCRWLSRRLAAGAGIGIILGHDSPHRTGWYTGTLGLSLDDRFGLVLRYDTYKTTLLSSGYQTAAPRERQSELYAGMRFGGEAGIVATAAVAIGVLIFLATLDLG